jgi:hypothetical protein
MFCNEFRHIVNTGNPVGLTREQRKQMTDHYKSCVSCGAWFDLEVLKIPDEVVDAYVAIPELVAVKRADREAEAQHDRDET